MTLAEIHTPEFLASFQFRCWPASGRQKDAVVQTPWVRLSKDHLVFNAFACSPAGEKIYDVFLCIPLNCIISDQSEWRIGYTTRSALEGRPEKAPINLTAIELDIQAKEKWFDFKVRVPPIKLGVNSRTRHYWVSGRIGKDALQALIAKHA